MAAAPAAATERGMAERESLIKEPPHSDEAELAVLGGVFIRNDALDEIEDQLHDEDFYRTAHQRVYSSMRALHARRDPIDPVTLTDELTRAGDFDSVGGIEFLARLGDITPTSANVVHYARIVSDKAVLRRLIATAQDILSKSYGASAEIEELLDHAVSGNPRRRQGKNPRGRHPPRPDHSRHDQIARRNRQIR
ncbi:MAG: hypothetical protein M5R36_17245 [Deltaproteobacteria bacterium]|nr:hypothetical protein [Deltaproteobacteria bacterium]